MKTDDEAKFCPQCHERIAHDQTPGDRAKRAEADALLYKRWRENTASALADVVKERDAARAEVERLKVRDRTAADALLDQAYAGGRAQGRREVAGTEELLKARGPRTVESMDIGHAPPTPSRPSHATASPAEIAAVAALIRRVGLMRAQRILGIDRHTMDRVRGGLPVHRGTMMCVRAGLAQSTPSERRP